MKLWCSKIWLYVMYLIGIIMAVLLYVKWSDWTVLQRCMCALAIILPLHVLEEWQYPAGFHYQYNLLYHSKYPDRYPMCRLSDMFTNLGGEAVFLILLTFWGDNIGVALANMMYCFLEVLVHTLLGVQSYNRFKDKGKRTIYGPGTITAYFGFGAVGLILLSNIPWSTMTTGSVAIGVLVLLAELVGMIVLPENFLKKEDNDYAFESAGYFDKYLR